MTVGYSSASSARVTFGLVVLTGASTVRSAGESSAAPTSLAQLAALDGDAVLLLDRVERREVERRVLRLAVELVADALDELAGGLRRVGGADADLDVLLVAAQVARSRASKTLPSRLASMASSTIPPTSAWMPASSAESVKRVLPWVTAIGCSSRSRPGG